MKNFIEKHKTTLIFLGIGLVFMIMTYREQLNNIFLKVIGPLFNPLLNIHPLLAVLIVSLLISIIIILITKYTTNQDLMKRLKEELKEFQNEMKELKEHPEEMMKVQKRAMETNMKYMMQSFRSTFFTILPIIMIFGWMNANFAYEPINPGENFQVTLEFEKGAFGKITAFTPSGIEGVDGLVQEIDEQRARFIFKGTQGEYMGSDALEFRYANNTAYKDIIITNEQQYAKKTENLDLAKPLKSITIDYEKKEILPVLNWGWLGTYIIFSIVFSMTLRKWFKVY